jgi:Glycosyl-hydrolase family 116, catalytic region
LKKQALRQAVVSFCLFSCATVALAASDIPKAAWSRPIGLPLENSGVTKDPGLIDDGYWQGAPVGGMGGRHLLTLLSRRFLPLAHETKPLWYRGMLFNELYPLADGGTFWGRQVGSDKQLPASFALLECFDYAYYATLDVRFYASLPLLKFWPVIDKQVLREFANTVPREWPEKGLWVWKTQQTGEPVLHKRKRKEPCPTTLVYPKVIPSLL